MPVKKRILYVEDDLYARELAAVFLDQFEVVLGDSQASGLLLAKTEYFDLYVLDVGLAYGNGLELCRQVRTFDPNTPVVFCTADAREASRAEAFSAGAQAYFVKPIDYFALRDTVDSLILKAEMKAIEAKMAELAAIQDEVSERLARLSLSLREQEFRSLKAQSQAMKATAGQAFSDAGGHRVAFERLWPEAFEEVLDRIQRDPHWSDN